MNRIKRARGTNSVMTGVFYLIAVFFFALLISFASYVIIKGFSGATPEMFRFLRKGSIGNQLFNTIYLVFIALVFSVPLGVTAGIYLSMYRSRFVWIPGIPCVFRTWKKSSCRSTFHFHTGNSSYYNDDGGCNQWTAR